MRKKYKQVPVLSHSSLREAKQVPVWVTPVCAKPNRCLFGSLQSARKQTGACLSHSSLREAKQVPVWVTPVCAKANGRLFESLQSARKQTGACLGAAAAAGEVWPGTRQFPPPSCIRQTSQPRQRPARRQTSACLSPSHLPNHHTTRYVLLHLVRLMKAGIIPLPDHALIRCLLLFFRRRRWCK